MKTLFRLLSNTVIKYGHIQFADVPARGQPESGTMNFEQLFISIEQSNYEGWVGAEYKPAGSTLKSLEWFAKYNR